MSLDDEPPFFALMTVKPTDTAVIVFVVAVINVVVVVVVVINVIVNVDDVINAVVVVVVIVRVATVSRNGTRTMFIYDN